VSDLKPVLQAAILFLICLLGEAIVSLFSLSFPSSVIAMILLFVLLLVGIIKRENVQEMIRFLQQNMSLFFIPSGVAIMNNISYLSQNLAAFLIICVIITIVTFAATAYTVQFVSRLMNRKGGGKA
jgi:holin-like protein